MPTIVVEVMPKAEILDPQGKAVGGALVRLGNADLANVRIGKRFEISVDGAVDEARLDAVRAIAADVFSNAVIEDVVSVTVEGQ
ncbi:phosphoribosylformylglycinamidine synthase subunit PurS [Curtobacterium ammoniigenes]|uniref:phosphoribosylformylglycinamidine synthase subunit PurS n=1 Tax=Curtobacterium ammoniigenes TaxID=395387 RepID=UPI0008321463|nr:phosphoribosylformylglycinamidine synthase subunit PurS [Curtobacterium ammoniigenes]